MNQHATNSYLRTKVFTATPEQIQLMLYDGAIRFAEQAKVALGQKHYEASYNALSRAQRIVAELTASLKHDVAPDLCGKLAALYNFIYFKLVEANIEHKLESLQEALALLHYQRETWMLLLEQLGKTKAAAVAKTLAMPEPSARMEASISMSG